MKDDKRIFRSEQMNENDKKVMNEALDSFYDKHYGKDLEDRLEAERKADPDVIEIDGVRYNKKYMNPLRRYRAEAGLSQSELSKKCGVNRRTLQDYEQGQKSINGARAITVYNIAQALECTVEDLIKKEEV